MSRYFLLFILNLPFVIVAVVGIVTRFKLGQTSQRRFVVQLTIWLTILAGLTVIHPLYTYLFDNHLTESEPLSIFDVVQITAIVMLFYLVNQARTRLEYLEHRVNALHKELSIQLAEDKIKK